MTGRPTPYTLLRRADDLAHVPDAPPLEGQAGERRAGLLRTDLERIIAERHFTLAYQPVVRLLDRRVGWHEALLRLQPRPDLPSLPASAFVDIAAGWGLSATLDEAVLDAALTAWAETGGTPISVNVAARSLQDGDFIGRILGRIGGEGAALLVEVTAAGAIDDMPRFMMGLAALQDVGVRVCLDDLGGDPTTLECMREARFDQVKIAGSVVRAAAAGDRGRRLVAAMVALAARVGADTVAKLVETLPQAWQMQELGVNYGQGWLFGPPGKLAP
jgi:EAL domain-containing protein (putative c-di-GMP-specific phosphodiesterase class I)